MIAIILFHWYTIIHRDTRKLRAEIIDEIRFLTINENWNSVNEVYSNGHKDRWITEIWDSILNIKMIDKIKEEFNEVKTRKY